MSILQHYCNINIFSIGARDLWHQPSYFRQDFKEQLLVIGWSNYDGFVAGVQYDSGCA